MTKINAQLADILVGLEAVHNSTAWIEVTKDAKNPGRKSYMITGRTQQAVQYAIDARMAEAEERGGLCSFIGPYRMYNGEFGARGEFMP